MNDEILTFLAWLRDEKRIVLCRVLGEEFFSPLCRTFEDLLNEWWWCRLPPDLETAAAKLFYAIPNVEEVRCELIYGNIVFWVDGNILSLDIIDAIVDAKWSLIEQFPERPIDLKITDHFGREPLGHTLPHASFWESLHFIPRLNL